MVAHASEGCNPSLCTPGTNSPMTNSKYSWSRSGAMSHVIMTLTGILSFLIFQDGDLGLVGKPGTGDLQGRLRLHFAQAHFLEEFIQRIQVDLCIGCGVMHGDDKIRFKHADDFRSL